MVKKELKRRGMEQAELAALVGTSAPTISRMLGGKQVTARHAEAVAHELGLPSPLLAAAGAGDFEWATIGLELERVDRDMKRKLVRKVQRYIRERRDLLAGTSDDDEAEDDPDDTK